MRRSMFKRTAGPDTTVGHSDAGDSPVFIRQGTEPPKGVANVSISLTQAFGQEGRGYRPTFQDPFCAAAPPRMGVSALVLVLCCLRAANDSEHWHTGRCHVTIKRTCHYCDHNHHHNSPSSHPPSSQECQSWICAAVFPRTTRRLPPNHGCSPPALKIQNPPTGTSKIDLFGHSVGFRFPTRAPVCDKEQLIMRCRQNFISLSYMKK